MTAVLNPATLTAMHEGVLMHSGEDGLVYLLTDAGEAIPLQDPIGLTALDSAQLTAMGGDWLVMNSAGELAILEPAAPRVVGDNLWEGQVRALAAPRAGSPICAAALRNATSAPRLSPGLRLDFTPGETLDPRITFTRASTATRFNASGLIESVAINAPRFDYDPVTLAPKGLLIEEARTNRFTESEFRNGVTDAPTRAGLLTATAFSGLFQNTGLAFGHDGTTTTYAYKTATLAATTTYAMSVFVRMDDGLAPVFGSATASSSANDFVLTIGSNVIAATTYAITSLGGGLYRVNVTTTTAASPGTFCGVVKYPTNSSRTFKVTGYQIEAGSFATSYIPTTTAAATRATDIAAITGTNFSSWLNPVEGTFMVEFDSAGNAFQILGEGSAVTGLLYSSARDAKTYNGATGIASPNLVAPSGIGRAAIAYNSAGRAICLNGGVVTEAAGLLQALSQLLIGGDAMFGGYLNGHIRSIRYYPVRLPNATLQSLTA